MVLCWSFMGTIYISQIEKNAPKPKWARPLIKAYAKSSANIKQSSPPAIPNSRSRSVSLGIFDIYEVKVLKIGQRELSEAR